MKRDPGDIIDRFSIATLKYERIPLASCHKEYQLFKEGFKELLEEYPDEAGFLRDRFEKAYKINAQIWDLESAVRQGHLDNNIEEVGRRAIKIRMINTQRIALCNVINSHLGEGTENVKKYHISSRPGEQSKPD